MSKTPPMVSIVIPAYNAERTMGRLLDSLMGLDYPDYEIIAVNDGSTDRTGKVIRGYPVQLIDQPNRGASAARAAGLRAAKGEIVAYVDSDVEVTENWLQRLVKPLEDPEVGATTGRTLFLRNETCTSWMRSLDIERRNARRGEKTRLANGPNCAFRRTALLEVGGFDPRWYHAEDTEVSYRLWDRGYIIRYVSDAVVHHVPEEDWRNFLQKRYRDARAFTRVLVRYPRSAILRDDFVHAGMKVQPPLFLGAILLALLALVLAGTSGGALVLLLLSGLVVVAVLLNLPEAAALARESGDRVFFFKGLGLGLMRGFAWGAGLGVGTLRRLGRT